MEKLQCDICKKRTVNLDTIILYNKTITYCDKCEEKVLKSKLQFKREVNYQNTLLDINLKNAEKRLIKELKKRNA
jgi:NAD-dependent SIR2 family protein deacetylase